MGHQKGRGTCLRGAVHRAFCVALIESEGTAQKLNFPGFAQPRAAIPRQRGVKCLAEREFGRWTPGLISHPGKKAPKVRDMAGVFFG